MAEFSKLRESVIFRYNVNEDGIPVSVKIENEQKQVSPLNNTVQLEQIPDPELDVVVLKNGVRMPQVDNEDEITDNTYYVDYSKGLIKFTKANAGKTTIINYYGKGVELISASRVYDEKSLSSNDVVKTLQEIIDIGKEYIEILGNVIATKKELGEMINVSTDLKNKLDNLNQEAVQNNKILTSTNTTATKTNEVLKQTISEAQDDINTINATGNKSLIIGSSSFVSNEYTWTHNMNNDNLIVNFIDSDTNEPLMPDYKIVDKNNILIRNSAEHPNVKVVLSASYYQGNSLFGTNVEEFADDSVGVNEKSVRLKDDNGTYQNPVTNSDSVFMADGKTKLTKKVDDISTQLEQIDNNKINKNGSGEVNWANIAQDARENISGNKVAVVGKDSVLEENIVNGQVTPIKTSFITHTETEQLINVMPLKLSQKGDFYSPDDGKLYNTDGTKGYKNTGKIYVNSKKYKSKGIQYILFYDINDSFISSYRVSGDSNLINNIQEITPPNNAHYMICDIGTIFWWDKDNTGKIYESFLYEIRDGYKYEKSLITDENLLLTDSYFLPKQIYDRNNITNGKYNLTTGIVESDSAGQYKCSPLMECYDVDYKFYGVRDILYFDEYRQYIGRYISHATDDLMANFQTVIPVRGAKYMAFNILKYYWERSEVFQLTDVNKVAKLENTYIENKFDCLNRYSGKTIINFGDSIFGNFESPSDISTIISHNLNCNAINMGFGGSRIASHLQDTNFDKFSFYNLVNSIVSNDFTLQENSLTASGIPSYYKERIATLKTIDWSKVTLITIAYGTNDWNGANLIENANNLKDTTTYKGAFRYSIEKLLNKYPHLKIVICTPIYRFKEDLSDDSDGNWIDVTTGQKLPQFVEACKEIGKEYKLKVIDNYYELGINKINRLYYFNSVDGTHPNYNGRELMADNISFNI